MQGANTSKKCARNVEEYLKNISVQENQTKKEQEYPMATAYAKMWKKERINQRDKSKENLEKPSKSQTNMKNLSNFSC